MDRKGMELTRTDQTSFDNRREAGPEVFDTCEEESAVKAKMLTM